MMIKRFYLSITNPWIKCISRIKMKKTIRTFMLLIGLAFLMTGCTESLIKAATDVFIDEVTDDDEEQPTAPLRLLQSDYDFGIEWNKQDTQYAEIIYMNNIDGTLRLSW
jgi:hypothetical protein